MKIKHKSSSIIAFIYSYSNTTCLTLQMCIDPTLSVGLGDKPPPLYICEECSQRIAGYESVPPLSSPRILPHLKYDGSETYNTYCLTHYSSLTQGKSIAMVT